MRGPIKRTGEDSGHTRSLLFVLLRPSRVTESRLNVGVAKTADYLSSALHEPLQGHRHNDGNSNHGVNTRYWLEAEDEILRTD